MERYHQVIECLVQLPSHVVSTPIRHPSADVAYYILHLTSVVQPSSILYKGYFFIIENVGHLLLAVPANFAPLLEIKLETTINYLKMWKYSTRELRFCLTKREQRAEQSNVNKRAGQPVSVTLLPLTHDVFKDVSSTSMDRQVKSTWLYTAGISTPRYNNNLYFPYNCTGPAPVYYYAEGAS